MAITDKERLDFVTNHPSAVGLMPEWHVGIYDKAALGTGKPADKRLEYLDIRAKIDEAMQKAEEA